MANRIIPNNYNSISNHYRNIIETVIFDGVYLAFIYILHKPFKVSMYIALGLIPITLFGILGIDGQSIVSFFMNSIKFKKNRRVLDTPTQEYIREKSKVILLKEQKNNKRKAK